MINLDGTASTACSFADGVNVQDQVVGGSCDGNALLWQQGATYDLNTLIAPSTTHITEAFNISDHGEIVGTAVLSNGNRHMVLLVPTGMAQSVG
jgi:uncharacterized membrane protein